MDRAGKIFILLSGFLLFIISLSGPSIEFNGLAWNLISTPGGMIYSALFGGDKVSYWFNYLIKQQTSTHGNVLQALLSVVASSTGLAFAVYRSEIEVELS